MITPLSFRKTTKHVVKYRMSKRKAKSIRAMDELINEIKSVEDVVTIEEQQAPKPENYVDRKRSPVGDKNYVTRKRNELISMSEGEMTQSISYLKEASSKAISEIYSNYEKQKQEEKIN